MGLADQAHGLGREDEGCRGHRPPGQAGPGQRRDQLAVRCRRAGGRRGRPDGAGTSGRPQGPRLPARCALTSAGRPLVVYFHGGGFALGSLDMGNWICGLVAASVGAVVVSADYRLAPSHVFPAAVEDCYAALAWAAGNAAELGATGRIGVMGESAGGNLAAVSCLIAQERGGPAISPPALIYPATDMTRVAPATADPH